MTRRPLGLPVINAASGNLRVKSSLDREVGRKISVIKVSRGLNNYLVLDGGLHYGALPIIRYTILKY